MRKLNPGREYPYFADIQAGVYAENKDTNLDEIFVDAAVKYGIDRDTFLEVMNATETREQTAADFHWSRTTGINEFPTVLAKDDTGLEATSRFKHWKPLKKLDRLVIPTPRLHSEILALLTKGYFSTYA